MGRGVRGHLTLAAPWLDALNCDPGEPPGAAAGNRAGADGDDPVFLS